MDVSPPTLFVVLRRWPPRARRVVPLLAACAALIALPACERPGADDPNGADLYETRTSQHPDGTGRFYMGREIAGLTGDSSDVAWMERPDRATSELPTRVVQALSLNPFDAVADIGAGSGYFTFRLAPEVPRGTVYAVDIQADMLRLIDEKAAAEGITNVETIEGTEQDPNLPANSVDVALIVDSYHEFYYPHEMLTHIVEALRPGGRLVLVEYRGEDPTLPVSAIHRMTEAQIRKEMAAVGLTWRETKDILPQQHFIVFEKPVA